MAEQEKLSLMSDSVVQRLSYFTEADSIIEKLGLPSFSIHSESFSHALDKIDGCIMFLHKKVRYIPKMKQIKVEELIVELIDI